MRFMSCLLNFSIYEYETTSYNIINDIDDKLSVCYNPKFHLITLDDNGSFTCQTGGEELAAVFYNGYDSPALHPLSFHVSSLGDSLARIHVLGK